MAPNPALTKIFGRLAHALHRDARDAETFEAARRAHAGYAHLLRGLALLDAGAREDARDDARAALGDRSLAVRVFAAQLLHWSGAHAEALTALDGALAAATREVERSAVLRVRALVQRVLGRYADALASLDAALAPGDAAVDGWVESAELCASLDWHDEAVRRLDRACALAPAASELHRRRAHSLVALGRFDEALAPAAAALTHARDGDEAAAAVEALVAAGDLDAAETALAQRPSLAGRPEAVAWRARFALWRGDTVGTRVTLDATPALAASHDGARMLAATDLLDGRCRAALDRLSALLTARADDAEAGFLRAEARLRLGDVEGARADADAARVQSGEHFPGYVVRLRAKLGGATSLALIHDEAAEVAQGLARVFEDVPEQLAAWPEVDAATVDLALRRLGGNRSEWATVVSGSGGLRRLRLAPTARFAMTRAQQRLGLAPTGEVIAALDRLVEAHPEVTMPLCYRGEVHLWLGDLDRARADFEASIRASWRTRWAYIGLGAVETLEGHHARAAAVFERLKVNAAPGPTLFVYRGEMHRRAGRRDAARSDLDVALRHAPQRLGARVNHGLWHLAWGDLAEARATAAWLAGRAPDHVAEVRRTAGITAEDATREALAAIFETSLRLMRGNRSSSIFTWFTADGALRRTPVRTLDDPQNQHERRLLRRQVQRALGLV